MAHRAPTELGHEHLRGKEREMLYQTDLEESTLQKAVEIEEEGRGKLLTCRRQRGASEWLPDCIPHPHLGRTTEDERRPTTGFFPRTH